MKNYNYRTDFCILEKRVGSIFSSNIFPNIIPFPPKYNTIADETLLSCFLLYTLSKVVLIIKISDMKKIKF